MRKVPAGVICRTERTVPQAAVRLRAPQSSPAWLCRSTLKGNGNIGDWDADAAPRASFRLVSPFAPRLILDIDLHLTSRLKHTATNGSKVQAGTECNQPVQEVACSDCGVGGILYEDNEQGKWVKVLLCQTAARQATLLSPSGSCLGLCSCHTHCAQDCPLTGTSLAP